MAFLYGALLYTAAAVAIPHTGFANGYAPALALFPLAVFHFLNGVVVMRDPTGGSCWGRMSIFLGALMTGLACACALLLAAIWPLELSQQTAQIVVLVAWQIAAALLGLNAIRVRRASS